MATKQKNPAIHYHVNFIVIIYVIMYTARKLTVGMKSFNHDLQYIINGTNPLSIKHMTR